MLYADNGKLLNGYQNSSEYQNYAMDAGIYFLICWLSGCECILGMMRRGEIRRKYGLEESPCNDCLVHCCCHPCAQCQESREMKFKLASGFPAAQNVAVPVYTGGPEVVHYPAVTKY